MVATIDQAFIDTFESNVRHLAQQTMSRVRPYVTERGEGSENHNWDRLGFAEAAAKVRNAATPNAERVWSRRVAQAKPFNDGELVELEDPTQMLIDPNSNLVESLGYSMRRQFDRTIIRAGGEALALNGDGTTTAFPAGQFIDVSTVDISFDLITQVQEKFMDNNIYPEVPKAFFVGPKQVRQLMQLTENTSSDYVQAQALQQYGIVPNWMGFTWIASTLLNDLVTPETNILNCLAFTKRAIGLHVPQDVHAEVMKDPGQAYAWRPYVQITTGAVRVEDEHIVKLRVRNL